MPPSSIIINKSTKQSNARAMPDTLNFTGSLSPTMNTPNWKHNSGKSKQTKGMCKGQIVARKQALKSLLLKLSK